MKKYTSQEMLEAWRRRLGFDDARLDCTVERFDGRDVNAVITDAMRQWYLGLLDTAPAHLLPRRKAACTVDAVDATRRLGRAALPEDARRVIEASSGHWILNARPTDFAEALPRLYAIASPYINASAADPLLIVGDSAIYAAPAEQGDTITLSIIAPPADGSYELDESLMATIPEQLFEGEVSAAL